jgi:hypothetical protein
MVAEALANYMPFIIGGGVAIGLAGVWGWVHTTKMRIQNGYPLEGMWGQSLKPELTSEAMERVKLLTQENAGLRAELASMKERLGNVERIVTDSGYRLTHEFESLKAAPGQDHNKDRDLS